jgi:hypothetical protein
VLGKRGPVGDFAAMAPPSGVPTTSARGQLMTRPHRRWLLTRKHRFQLVGKHGWVSAVTTWASLERNSGTVHETGPAKE